MGEEKNGQSFRYLTEEEFLRLSPQDRLSYLRHMNERFGIPPTFDKPEKLVEKKS